MTGPDRASPPGDALARTVAPHPEAMLARVELTIGRSIALRESARATPAGLAAAAGLAMAVLVPAIWIVRGWKRKSGDLPGEG